MLYVLTKESMTRHVKMTEIHNERGNVFEISRWHTRLAYGKGGRGASGAAIPGSKMDCEMNVLNKKFDFMRWKF
jgi:hypothetical protein